MHRIPRRLLALAAAAAEVLAAVLALALRGGNGHGAGVASVGTATTAATSTEQAASGPSARFDTLARCLRSHGYAVPDPTIGSDGTPDWGGAAGGLAFKRALQAVGFRDCAPQLQALPSGALNPAPTAAALRQLRLFSRCMRAHGVPDWPDPRPDGTFPLDSRLVGLGKTGLRVQMQACGRYLAGGKGISVSPGSAPGGTSR
jgi:hypothetical protein